ncbi:MAG: STAS domain-containing protein [Candidatus Latescibacteria bacterium]|nr:STAS domain-containing protein [Candidatus Latescibacterota bacterium]
MIRIDSINPSPGQVVLKMAGQLTWENTAVLEREGRRWLQKQQRLVLELNEVDFIDAAGVALLKRLVQRGGVLRRASPFIALLLSRHGLFVCGDPPP